MLSSLDVTALRASVTGPVFLPSNGGFTEECLSYNLLRTVRPAVVVGAASVQDVAAAVRFAADRGMPVAVKNAGHQMVLPAPGDAILVTTSRMDELVVDKDRRTAWVGAGVRWNAVIAEAAKVGLAPVAGSAPGVGVVGYTLGGGISPLLGRSLGYAADHVKRLTVVTADGQVRVVGPHSEPELYWALLGGKGNFGIVTGMEFSLFPVTRFHGGGIWFRGDDMAQVLAAWREWLPTDDEGMTSSVAVQRLPDAPGVPEPVRGAFVLHVRVGYLGRPEQGERLVAPLRDAAEPLLDTVRERPVDQVGEIHVDPVQPLPYVEAGLGLAEFSVDTIAAFVGVTGPESDCSLASVEVRALGGALDREPEVANAVPSRGLPFISFAFGVGGPADAAVLDNSLTAYRTALVPWASDRNVMNFVPPDEAKHQGEVRRLYGRARHDRLVAAKRRHDPDNLFRVNHNITPA